MSIISKRIHDRACTCIKCLDEFEAERQAIIAAAAAPQAEEAPATEPKEFNPDWDQIQAARDSVREHMSIAAAAIARAEKAEAALTEEKRQHAFTMQGADVEARDRDEQKTRADKAVKDRDHWKANHDNMVARCAILSQRDDLPVDRLPAYRALVAAQERVEKVEAALAEWSRITEVSLALDYTNRAISAETKLAAIRSGVEELPVDLATDYASACVAEGYARCRKDVLDLLEKHE